MGRMTRDEIATKEYLADKLAEQGYVTYSELFELFDLRLTYNPTVLGYMEPGKGRITLNGTLDEHTLTLIIRHEIMHEYLTHEIRAIRHLARKKGIDEDDIDDITLEDIKKNLYSNDLFNIAGDYEISNRTYTDQDKKDIRRIKLNGQIVSGLVTELDHPDWVDLPLEDMYDLLQQEREQASKEAKDDLEQNKQEQPNDGEGQGSPSSGSGDRSSDSNQQGQQVGNSEDNSGMSKQGGDTEGPGQAGEKGDQSTSDEGDGQGSNGSSDGENGNPSNNSSDDSSQSNGSVDQGNGSDTGSKNDGSSDSRSSNGSSNKIIHGTFKNGKFYGLDGKEIIPGGNA